MAESKSHIYLIEQLSDYVIDRFNIPDRSLFLDHRDSLYKPPNINGFIPDLFYLDTLQNMLIIGEAKTSNDIENSHTNDQFYTFIKRCSEYKNSFFFVAVPWFICNYTNSKVRKICLENNFSVNYEVIRDLKDSK